VKNHLLVLRERDERYRSGKRCGVIGGGMLKGTMCAPFVGELPIAEEEASGTGDSHRSGHAEQGLSRRAKDKT
jgi:hypothetical protein